MKKNFFFNIFSSFLTFSSLAFFCFCALIYGNVEEDTFGEVEVGPMDGAVGAGVFVVEVECAGEFVALVEPAPRVVKDDGVGIVGAIHGVGNADAVGTAEVDNESGILGGAERGVAFTHIHDGPTESYLVMLDAAGQQG